MPKRIDNINDKADKRRRLYYRDEAGVKHWGQGKGTKADREVSKAVNSIVKKYGPSGPGDGGDILVKDYVEKWLTIKAADVREGTLRCYKYVSRKHIVPSIGNMKIASVRPSDMSLCLAKSADLSAATRNKVVFLLRSIFASADLDGILAKNPSRAAKRKKDSDEKRMAFSDHEDKAITSKFSDTSCLALPILYYTGMRRGELFGLQWKHVNFGMREITVDQQVHWTKSGYVVDRNLKTTNSHRIIPIPDELVDILAPMRGLDSVYVIQNKAGKHCTAIQIEAMLDFLRVKTGLPDFIFHRCRHNYATRLYKAGIPVKEAAAVMGETVSTMMKTYVHIEKQLGEESQNKIRSAFSAKIAEALPVKKKKQANKPTNA